MCSNLRDTLNLHRSNLKANVILPLLLTLVSDLRSVLFVTQHQDTQAFPQARLCLLTNSAILLSAATRGKAPMAEEQQQLDHLQVLSISLDSQQLLDQRVICSLLCCSSKTSVVVHAKYRGKTCSRCCYCRLAVPVASAAAPLAGMCASSIET